MVVMNLRGLALNLPKIPDRLALYCHVKSGQQEQFTRLVGFPGTARSGQPVAVSMPNHFALYARYFNLNG
jgi:hypothetical protein